MNPGSRLGQSVREAFRPEAPQNPWQSIGQAAREVAQALEPVRYEMWRTQDDERTCPICGALDGMIWPVGAGFIPPVHDHCRCERIYHHTEFRNRSDS